VPSESCQILWPGCSTVENVEGLAIKAALALAMRQPFLMLKMSELSATQVDELVERDAFF